MFVKMVSIVLALALFVGVCKGAPSSSRIHGGTPTTVQVYPSIVQVEFLSNVDFWYHSCGANILTNNILVSAAHCFEFRSSTIEPHRRRIRAGTTYREQGGIVVNVAAILNHPLYNIAVSMDSDINLVRLSTNLVFGDGISPVSIIPHGFVIPDNAPVINAGWGLMEQAAGYSPVLRDVTIFKVNHEICRQRYGGGNRINTNMICAGVLDVGGKDSCGGDSGGPLYYGGVLAGIVSFGRGACANPVYPGVNTRLSAFTNWILDNYQNF